MNAILALLVTTLISAMLPALGPWVQFLYRDTRPTDTLYIADVLLLRSGGAATFVLARMQGIVCFPSYHTVLAILLIYAHRGLRWSLPPVLVINSLMLLSIPSEGGHYLADMFAGGSVAVVAIAITRNARKAAPVGTSQRGHRLGVITRGRPAGRSDSISTVRAATQFGTTTRTIAAAAERRTTTGSPA
jgi:hypothetical protein